MSGVFEVPRLCLPASAVVVAAAGLVTLSVLIGMQVSAATMRTEVRITEPLSEQAVNRAHKGDRITASRVRANGTQRLPRGCEALVSPIADPRLANVAIRCLS